MNEKINDNVLVTVNSPKSGFHGQSGYVDEIYNGGHTVTVRFATEVEDQFEKAAFNVNELIVVPAQPSEDYVAEDRPEMLESDNFNPIAMAIGAVKALHYPAVGDDDIYVVWFCKTLQNWKAMVSTNIKDNSYYEVTYNGAKNQVYVDRYVKAANTMIDHTTGEVTQNTYMSDMFIASYMDGL